MLEKIITAKRHELNELDAFTRVCANALSKAPKAVEHVELIQKINVLLGDPPAFETEEEFTRAKEEAAEAAAFGTRQKALGFPQLYSLLIVRVWTLLESAVDELAVAALIDPHACGTHPVLSKLKGPLVEFRRASPEEQAEFLADSLKQALDASLKPGVGRFEALLDPIGLGGAVDPVVRRSFLEFSNVRNAIVHKGGKADRRLVESCPWMGVEKGADIPINSHAFEQYVMCTYWYLLELRGRISKYRGGSRLPAADEAQVGLVAALQKQYEKGDGGDEADA